MQNEQEILQIIQGNHAMVIPHIRGGPAINKIFWTYGLNGIVSQNIHEGAYGYGANRFLLRSIMAIWRTWM